MRYRLPPLHTLRAVEAVARLLSFSKAAEEIHVTHGAVSQQVKLLEEFLGTQLFLREHRSVTVTPVGAKYVAVVRAVLDQLDAATRESGGAGPPTLSVSVLPSFASRWLLPRLGEFIKTHPEIDVAFSATQRRVAPDGEGVDLALRYGRGRWEGVRSDLISHEDVMPVASPSLIRAHRLTSAKHLNRSLLLRDAHESWPEWHAAVGLPFDRLNLGPVFDDAGLLLQAAEAGQGVALARQYLVADALRARTLVRIGSKTTRSRNAYFFVFPVGRPASESTMAFVGWLRERMLSERISQGPPHPPS